MNFNRKNFIAIAAVLLVGLLSFNARVIKDESVNSANQTEVVSDESPCTDCLESAKNAYAICSSNAGSDTAGQSACTKTVQNAVAQCNAGPCNY